MASQNGDTTPTNTTTATSADDNSRSKVSETLPSAEVPEKIAKADPLIEALCKLGYYHGLLPKEDTVAMLEEVGDYLVRISSTLDTEDRQLVLSIRYDSGSSSFSHIIITQAKNKFLVDRQISFDTIPDLIHHYHKLSKPLNPANSATVPLSPVFRKKWELHNNNVELTKSIGKGQFGDVFLGSIVVKGKKTVVAVKIGQGDHLDKGYLNEIMAEVRIMRGLRHPNIVKFYGVTLDCEPVMVIMEHVKGGSLEQHLRNNVGTMTISDKVDIMVYGAAKGLEYLHASKVIHRDIAARNVLYNTESVKLSDFGLSREGPVYQLTNAKKVAFKHMSPELFNTFLYSMKSDVYAFGVLIWEIFTDGEEPYPEKRLADVKTLVLEGHRLPLPEHTPSELKHLVEKQCWSKNPEDRWTMKQIVKKVRLLVKKKLSNGSAPPSESNLSAEDPAEKHSKGGTSPEETGKSPKSRKPPIRRKKKRSDIKHATSPSKGSSGRISNKEKRRDD